MENRLQTLIERKGSPPHVGDVAGRAILVLASFDRYAEIARKFMFRTEIIRLAEVDHRVVLFQIVLHRRASQDDAA